MAPPTERQLEARVHQLVPLRVVGLENRDVHVAVADVATPRDESPVLLCQLGHAGQVVGNARPREDGIDQVVAPGRLADEERPLASGNEPSPRRRGRTYTSSAPSSSNRAADRATSSSTRSASMPSKTTTR